MFLLSPNHFFAPFSTIGTLFALFSRLSPLHQHNRPRLFAIPCVLFIQSFFEGFSLMAFFLRLLFLSRHFESNIVMNVVNSVCPFIRCRILILIDITASPRSVQYLKQFQLLFIVELQFGQSYEFCFQLHGITNPSTAKSLERMLNMILERKFTEILDVEGFFASLGK